MKRSRLALLGAVAGLVAACGGGERSPSAVAKDYAAGKDPDKCEDVAPELLERGSKLRGKAAVDACRRQVESVAPLKDVEVRDETVRADRAEVDLRAGGQDVTIRLERRDGRWLVTGTGG